MTTPPALPLYPEDIARIWTEERRKSEGADAPEVPIDRVHDFVRWSKPTPEGNKWPHRYASNPVPYPRATRGRQPSWMPDQEQDLRDWWHGRLPTDPRDETAVAGRIEEWKQALSRPAPPTRNQRRRPR